MRKKHWIIGLLALLVLMVGVGSGTVIAQEISKKGGRPIQGVVARVAVILGLEEQQVQDAFDQARQEMRDEASDRRIGQQLDALVENGRITQEQSDELREWYASRPDSFWVAAGTNRGEDSGRHKDRKSAARGSGSHMEQKKHMKAGMGRSFGMHLAGLIEKGLITQEQADEIRSMYAAESRGFGSSQGFDRGKGFGRNWGEESREPGQFSFKGPDFSGSGYPEEGEIVPATTAPETPAATPTAPTDSANDN